ncbi:RhoGAP-domain-containing protein [Myriangium duriaei CBS 260.36]|uniref:RhoGAP-domain-containing protein n=1 Tax=Myriangium duriaei CBS 260.36 TaxID=1168546 RepID=A0A9P4J3U3_9PEZI|nr:RhoGAP-domain-containing protein [Myriangium duriaei CBS 260.36]
MQSETICRERLVLTEVYTAPAGIFGIPLHQSIRYANVAISLFNDEGQSYIYGYVPIVVAKCGVFLKEKATETEGIFRLAGSEKRIKELKIAFDSPERYGKGLDWTGYTVHDAANILRRYFNQLPEPIIPLDFYERFREPLRNHQQQAVGQMESQTPDSGVFDAESAIRAYQGLITELPPLNRQLLLYILDLLAVFASKSDLNKMNTPNLAAIFQPGILSHPQHDMAPQEYRLSQDVLIFLIENQDSFLIGMHGTAADEKTVKDVQSGYQPPPPQSGSPTGPGRSRTVLGRSSSNASGGSQGTRKFSGMRRNLSTSSRNSRQSSVQPGSPALGSPSLAGGVHRSNTVPSQRHGASPRFSAREKGSDPPTPITKLPPPIESAVVNEEATEDVAEQDVSQVTPQRTASPSPAPHIAPPSAPEVISASSSEATTPLAAPGSDTSSAILIPKDRFDRENRPSLLAPEAARRDGSHERSGSRTFLDRFRPPPGSEQLGQKEQRQPRKLQKKRIPGSSLSSAHSSSNDLGEEHDDATDSVASPVTPQYRETDPMSEVRTDASSGHPPRAGSKETPQQRIVSDSLRPGSPHQSVQSRTSVTDISDAEFLDEQMANEKQDKKKRWRFSHSTKARSGEGSPETSKSTPPMPALAANSSTFSSPDASRVNSGAHNFQPQGELPHASTNDSLSTEHSGVLSDSDEKKKGPMSWIRGKIQERKEKDAEKRAKSPTGGFHHETRRSVQMNRDTTAEHSGKSAEAPHQETLAPSTVDEPAGASPAGTPTPTPSNAGVVAEIEAAKAEFVPSVTEEKSTT